MNSSRQIRLFCALTFGSFICVNGISVVQPSPVTPTSSTQGGGVNPTPMPTKPADSTKDGSVTPMPTPVSSGDTPGDVTPTPTPIKPADGKQNGKVTPTPTPASTGGTQGGGVAPAPTPAPTSISPSDGQQDSGGQVVPVDNKPAPVTPVSPVTPVQPTPVIPTVQAVTIITQKADGTQKSVPVTIITMRDQPVPIDSVTIYTPWNDHGYIDGMAALQAAQGRVTIIPYGQQMSYSPVGDDTIQNYMAAAASFATMKPAGSGDSYVKSTLTEFFGRLVNNIQWIASIIQQLAIAGKPLGGFIDQMNQAETGYATTLSIYKDDKKWSALYTNNFQTPVNSIVFQANASILNNMATQPAALLDDTALAAAQRYHDAATAVWSDTLIVPGFASAADAADDLHTNMATVALNVFKNHMNAMRPEDNVTSVSDLFDDKNPNIVLLKSAKTAMGGARDAYVSYTDKTIYPYQDKSQISLYHLYDSMYTNLDNAVKTRSSILGAKQLAPQENGSQSSIVSTLIAGGAEWLGNHWQAVGVLLLADDSAQQGKKAFDGVTKTLNAPFQKALADAQANTNAIEHLDKVFTSLGVAASKAHDAYVAAATRYGKALQLANSPSGNGNLLTVAQMAAAANKQKLYTAAANITQQAAGLFVADQLPYAINRLQALTVEAINETQSYFSQAIPVLKQMDSEYSDFATQYHNDVGAVVPFYAAVPNQLFASFIAQYAAHEFLAAAAQHRDDEGLVASLYLAAYAYDAYFTDTMRSGIIADMATQNALVSSAQAILKHASDTDVTYAAVAPGQGDPTMLGVWDAALSAARAVYTVWADTKDDKFQAAPQLYRDCLTDYFNSHALLAQPDVDIRSAALLFRQYLFVVADPMFTDPQPETLAQQINGLLAPFFEEGSNLVAGKITATETAPSQEPEKTDYAYRQKLEAVSYVLAWQQSADWLVEATQTALRDQHEATPGVTLKELIQRQVTDATVTYRPMSIISAAPKVTINIQEFNTSLADKFEQYADWALDQAIGKECVVASSYYSKALINYANAYAYYVMLGNNDAAVKVQVKRQMAMAEWIAQSVKTVMSDTTMFKGLISPDTTVYGHYILSTWIQQVPSVIVQSSAMDAIRTDLIAYQANVSDQALQSSVQEDLKDIAAALYLYVYLHLYGWYNAFLSKNYDVLGVIHNMKLSVSGEGISECVANARDYRRQLDVWAKGFATDQGTLKTTFAFVAGETPLLIACNMPIDSVPSPDSADQQVNPTAALFYSYAIQLYQNVATIDPLQDVTEQISPLLQAVNTTYLSAAYQLERLAAYLLGKNVDKSLIDLLVDANERADFDKQHDILNDAKFLAQVTTLDPDPSANLAIDQDEKCTKSTDQKVQLACAVDTVADYYTAAATLAASAAASDTQQTSSDQLKTDGLVGYLYEQKGAALAQFLLGDPSADVYQAQLDRCKDAHVYASAAYNHGGFYDRALAAQTSFALVYEKVGQAFVSQELYINSVRFFRTASQIYQDIVAWLDDPKNTGKSDATKRATALANAQRTALIALVMTFKSATASFLNWGRLRWASTIQIGDAKFVTSAKRSAFKALSDTCSGAQAFLSDDVSAMCDNLQPWVLDALIYFLAVQQLSGQYLQLWYPTAQAAPVVTDAQKRPDNPVVAKYITDTLTNVSTKKQCVGTGDPSKINTLQSAMSWCSNVDSDLLGVLNGLMFQYVDEKGMLINTQDKSLPTALTVIQAWAGKLFSEMLSLFIATYYCDPPSQCLVRATSNVLSQIRIEAQNLANPSKPYFG